MDQQEQQGTPSAAEVRDWARTRKLPTEPSHVVVDEWNRAHPERPFGARRRETRERS